MGLIVTFATGLGVSLSDRALDAIFIKNTFWIFCIIELVLAIILSIKIKDMDPTLAKVLYIAYTFFSGLTFSSIFVVYKMESIIMVFGIAALLFLIFGCLGFKSKVDLTKLGTYLMMILIGIIIVSIINIFIGNSTIDLLLSIFGVIVFLGFIAYDVQKIDKFKGYLQEDNLAIIVAFELYLDFINLFIDLLRLFGNSKD